MNVSEFIEFMKNDFSSENIENNQNNFFEFFFYYKRNIRDFLSAYKTFNQDEQNNIIRFLLHLYPLSDTFLVHILKENEVNFQNEIMLDTVNYISSAFVSEIGDLNLNFDEEINNTLKKMLEIRDIIELNQDKMNKLLMTKKELSTLKEKNENLTKEIKELESGNISILRDEILAKQKKYDDLKNEKSELTRQLDKIKNDLNQLDKYSDFREKVSKCREIMKEMNLPKDFPDKIKATNDV